MQRLKYKGVLEKLPTSLQKRWHVNSYTDIELKIKLVSSVTQQCPALCNPMDCSTPGFPVHHQLPELAQTHVHQVMMPSNHLILCCPLLLLPSTFPSIRIFSNESVLHIRCPKDWSFSFSIGFSSDYSGLISFRIDWSDLLAVQGTLKSLLQHQFKSINSLVLSFFYSPNLTSTHDYWKNHSFDYMYLFLAK